MKDKRSEENQLADKYSKTISLPTRETIKDENTVKNNFYSNEYLSLKISSFYSLTISGLTVKPK